MRAPCFFAVDHSPPTLPKLVMLDGWKWSTANRAVLPAQEKESMENTLKLNQFDESFEDGILGGGNLFFENKINSKWMDFAS